MGKVRANNALGTVQGKIGELAFAHRQDGEILVRKAPVRTEPFTEAELKNQSRFARAVLFVTALKADPGAYAVYKQAAQVRRKRACDLAMADFLHPPVIQSVDLAHYTGRAGDTILLEAVDTLEVKDVRVRITGADGLALEAGAAERQEDTSRWAYRAQQAVPGPQTLAIEVSATDHAGNSVSKVFYHPISTGG